MESEKGRTWILHVSMALDHINSPLSILDVIRRRDVDNIAKLGSTVSTSHCFVSVCCFNT